MATADQINACRTHYNTSLKEAQRIVGYGELWCRLDGQDDLQEVLQFNNEDLHDLAMDWIEQGTYSI